MMSEVVLQRLDDAGRLVELAREADREGHAFVARMIAEWIDGANRFDGLGERAYVATADERVIGVGGLNIDPYVADPTVGRVRHLFVSAEYRRSGIASLLLDRIIEDARATFSVLRLRTRNADAAAFYRARGFENVGDDEFCTHARGLSAQKEDEMDMEAMVRDAYDRLGRWDSEALLGSFADDAKFFVPGRTKVSGDHDRKAIPSVLETMRQIAAEGFRRDILAVVPTSAGAMVVLHEYVTRDGEEINYHSVHDWDVRNGKVAYWWIYVHEYDAFERAWS